MQGYHERGTLDQDEGGARQSHAGIGQVDVRGVEHELHPALQPHVGELRRGERAHLYERLVELPDRARQLVRTHRHMPAQMRRQDDGADPVVSHRP